MVKEQLCWACQKACGDCSWSSCFQPVEGWTAEVSGVCTGQERLSRA